MVDADRLHWICSVPIGATIAILGLIGNIISMIVWKRIIKTKLRSNQSTALYLIALGICDSGLLLFFLLTDTLKSHHPEIVHSYSYAAFFSWFGFPVFFFFLIASIWLVVGVTINRFVMITFPTRVRGIYSQGRTYASISAFLLFSVIINIPHVFNFHPKEMNGTYTLELTEYGHSEGSINYEFWVHCIFLVLAPWFSIAVLNASIVYQLMKQMRKFETKGKISMNKKQAQEKQMTRMLLFITFSFLILLAWQCISQCFFMLGVGKDEPATNEWNIVNASFAFGKLGVVINSSINWIFYCFSGTMFRKEMIKMFKRMSGTNVFSTTMSISSGKTTKTHESDILENSNV